MYASDLNGNHIGRDLTITVAGLRTGGRIRHLSRFGDFVNVNLDGTVFSIDGDKPVELNDNTMRVRVLAEGDYRQFQMEAELSYAQQEAAGHVRSRETA